MVLLCTLGCLQLKAEKNKFNDGAEKNESVSPFTLNPSGSSFEGITESGFFVHFGIVIPSKNYFFPVEFDNDSDFKYGIGPCLELGHMFRITELDDNIAIGIRGTWFSALYTKLKIDDTTSLDALQGSIMRAGPYFTYGLSDEIAIDAYYQIGPAVLVDIYEDEGDPYLGATHSIGIGFRFNVLSVGMDYNFGNLKYIGDNEFIDPDIRFRTNHMRLYVGVKI